MSELLIHAEAEEARQTAYEEGFHDGYNQAMSEMPNVVRCKDCKWWETKSKGCRYGYCHACKHGYHSEHWEIEIYRTYPFDWFCADGERKEQT